MSSSESCDLSLLFNLARRRNPKRPFLVVSSVLAKHVPADARIVLAAGRLLAERVTAACVGQPDRPGTTADLSGCAGAGVLTAWSLLADPDAADRSARTTPAAAELTVVGFCETAVGLGATVADALRAEYIHSTRYPRPGQHHLVNFSESHSHAPDHVIAHHDADALAGTGTVVLVDDELTTGRTALAAIEQIHERWPRRRYVLAALLDWRAAADLHTFTEFEDRTGASVTVVSLHHGDGNELITPEPEPAPSPAFTDRPGVAIPEAYGPGAVTVHLFPELGPGTPFPAGSCAHHDAADEIATALAGLGVTAVVGVEECMYLPILVAARLGTTAQSTTLSPVVVSVDTGYPIRSVVAFSSPFGNVDAYAYNIPPGARVAVITDGGEVDANLTMAAAIGRQTGNHVDLVLTGVAATCLGEAKALHDAR